MTFLPNQQKVVDEKAQCDKRRVSLDNFRATAEFGALPIDEQDRLGRQAEVMRQLSNILTERIVNFTPSTDIAP